MNELLTLQPSNIQDMLAQATPETEERHGTCVIVYIEPADEYLFFIRDDKPGIPHPGRICPIGGRREHERGETKEEGIRREFAEEVRYKATGIPVALQNVKHLKKIGRDDGREGSIDMFGSVFKEDDEMTISEGMGLVRLNRQETLEMEFPYGFTETIHAFARSHSFESKRRTLPYLASVLQSVMSFAPGGA